MSTVSGIAGICSSLPSFIPSPEACKKIALCAVALAALSELPSADAVVLPMAAVAAPSAMALNAVGTFLMAANPLTLAASGLCISAAAFTGWVFHITTSRPDAPSLSEANPKLRKHAPDPWELTRKYEGVGVAL